jgi:O-antigen/teichoic acid export membrane protein
MNDRSIVKKVVAGTIWMVAARWCMRLIGLVSTIILARLLSPEDFGLIAISMLTIGFVEVFAETGLSQSIIRHPNPDRRYFDTVWTLQILIGLCLTVSIYLLAPIAAEYFQEERITLVMRLLGLRALVQGFQNPGVIWFQKNMEFNKDFQLLVWQRSIRFLIVIVLAVVFRNYWALVFAMISAKILGVALSYILHPFRPRYSFSRVKEVWSFSAWMLVVHIGHFLNGKIDEFLIGGLVGTKSVGLYTVAVDIAQSPTQEVVMPISRVLFPAFSEINKQPEQLERVYLKAFSGLATVCLATGVGVALVSSEIVTVFLGGQWETIKTVMPWLALSAIFLALSGSMSTFLGSKGQAKSSAALSWFRLVFLVPILYLAAKTGNLEFISSQRLWTLALLFPPTLIWFSIVGRISLLSLMAALWRPIIAALFMALCVSSFEMWLSPSGGVSLILKVMVGAISYSVAIFSTWHFSGQVDGLEKIVVNSALKAGKKIARNHR